ncbi:CSMD3 [Symbiodinium sp. CCMP2592]|nr:CSMD3 [Symbiodinium sp. CCMP2592]
MVPAMERSRKAALRTSITLTSTSSSSTSTTTPSIQCRLFFGGVPVRAANASFAEAVPGFPVVPAAAAATAVCQAGQTGDTCIAQSSTSPTGHGNGGNGQCDERGDAEELLCPVEVEVIPGQPQPACRVCATIASQDWGSTGYQMDQGEIRWAPNSSDSSCGALDDSLIDSYEVWIVDSCGQKLELVGALRPRIQVWTAEMLECCHPSWYALPLSGLVLPPVSVGFLIVPFQGNVSFPGAMLPVYHRVQTSTTSSASSTSTTSSSSSSTSSTTTSSTSTSSTSSSTTLSTTSSVSVTSTTSATTTTSLTVTSITSVTRTFTTRTFTYTIIPGDCPLPLTDVTQNALDCLSKTPGETCEVVCAEGFDANATTLLCSETEVFEGPLPTCTRPCVAGLPGGLGILSSDCEGKVNGQSCEVSCDVGFAGAPVEYFCNPTGFFEGPGLECAVPTCTEEGLPSGLDTSDCANTELFRFCFVRCPAGYVFNEAVFLCQSSGIFLGTAPECQRLSCSSNLLPQQVGLNISDCLGTFAGSSCLVSCELGYEGISSIFSCDLDGTFNGLAPSCARKVCPIPSRLVASELSTDCAGVQHLDRCIGRCMPGYTGSPTELRCFDGQLTGPSPRCLPNTCSLFGFSLGSGVNVTDCVGARTSQNCSLDCERGYFPVGVPAMSCQSDGSFLRGNFSCLPTPCGGISKVSPFDEARFGDSCISQSFGDFCSVFCETGWTILGNATLMICDAGPNSSAGYTESLSLMPAETSQGPTCISNPCRIGLPNILGVQHDCLGKTTLQTCTVNASFGFTMEGPSSAVLQCHIDGQFVGTVPEVKTAQCPSPNFDASVGSTCENKSIGAECWAFCKSGFTGDPQPYLCVADEAANLLEVRPAAAGTSIACQGQNSSRRLQAAAAGAVVGGEPPPRELLAACNQPAVDGFGLALPQYEHSCASLLHEELCIAHCSLGWEMTGSATLLVCDNGALSGGVLPACAAQQCSYNVPSAVGLRHNCSNVTTGEICTASCTEEGFEHSSGGPELFECMPSGAFSGTLPPCQRRSCLDLVLDDSKFAHNCRDMVFLDTCGVTCARGWNLVGWASQFECGSEGDITGVPPTCVGNPCVNNLPVDQAFSGEDCSGLTTGMTCAVTCKPGSTENSAVLTCGIGGSLVGELPVCLPATCATSPTLQDPSVAHDCEDVAFGQGCSVYCADGYQLASGQTGEMWQCLLDGSRVSLSGVLPVCEAVTCPGLTPSNAFTDNCSNLPAGEFCERGCARGFRPAGSGSVERYNCSLDGGLNSDGAEIRCQPVSCSTDFEIPHVVHTCAGVLAGQSCFAYCSPGYGVPLPEVALPWQGFARLWQVLPWNCSADDSPVVRDAPLIDGYGLRGRVPECVPQICAYNIPFGPQFSHDCQGIVTDQSCNVSCAAGFAGPSVTWSCGTDGVLNGTYPTCSQLPATRTSTTMSTASTVTGSSSSTSSVADLLVQILGELDLVSSPAFLDDSKVPEGLDTGLRELLGTPEAEVQVTLEQNATQDSVVHVAFVADARFYSSQEVENFFARAGRLSEMTELEVRALLNRNLLEAGAGVEILSLRGMWLRPSTKAGATSNGDIVVLVEGPEAEAPPDNSIGVAWLLVAASFAIALLSGVLACFYFKTAGRSQEPTAGEVDFEQPELTGATAQGPILPTAGKAAKGAKGAKGGKGAEETLAVIVDSCEDTELAELELKEALDALDELGIDFVEDEEQSEQSERLREALAAAGIEVLEDDDQSAGIEFKDSELAIEDALAAAGIELQEDEDSVVAREREPARDEKLDEDDDILMV